MTLIFWAVVAATLLIVLTATPRKAAPGLITLLLVVLIALGAGDA